jgi:hypothetical protein
MSGNIASRRAGASPLVQTGQRRPVQRGTFAAGFHPIWKPAISRVKTSPVACHLRVESRLLDILQRLGRLVVFFLGPRLGRVPVALDKVLELLLASTLGRLDVVVL